MPLVSVELGALYRRIHDVVASGAFESPQEFILFAIQNQLEAEVSVVGRRSEVFLASPSAHGSRLSPQLSRLFPLKVCLRRLGEFSDGGDAPRVPGVFKGIAAFAIDVGQQLRAMDRAAKRVRDLVATGFPASHDARSQQRFVEQYLARVGASGRITPGALETLGLVEFSGGVVKLTAKGTAFSKLRNPVLDDKALQSGSCFSPQEQEFFVREVVASNAAEGNDAKVLLAAIDGPESASAVLHAALARTLPVNWSSAQRRSYTSALASRLVECAVLRRTWKGRNTFYSSGPNSRLIR